MTDEGQEPENCRHCKWWNTWGCQRPSYLPPCEEYFRGRGTRSRRCPICDEVINVDMPYCHNCGYPTDELKRQADYESTPEYRRRQVEAARERYEQKLGEVEEQALKRHEERAWEKVLERQRKHIEEAMEETKPESKLVNAIVYLLCFAGYAFVAFAIYHGCTGP